MSQQQPPQRREIQFAVKEPLIKHNNVWKPKYLTSKEEKENLDQASTDDVNL